MELSRHNVFSRVRDTGNYFLVNLLSGNADLLTPAEAKRYQDKQVLDDREYIEKGYVADIGEEEKLFRSKYLDFLDARENDEVQLFYVPNYTCNFSCSYCYQSEYLSAKPVYSPDLTDSFFRYISHHFGHRKHYVTLFGGEPLLPGAATRQFLEHFTTRCREHETELAVVTNGYTLKEYLPLFAGTRLREIQVTLDGTESVHDARRHTRNGKGTFREISEGIDLALEQSIPVNLRMVLDRDNINELPALAKFAKERGWTDNAYFKTQLGRNYELHFCQTEQNRLYSRIELYQDIYQLIRQHPEILDFHKPAFSVSRFLFEQGELPQPLFDSCPGCKTEWAFDYTGKIYACTAAVGKEGEELGTFHPEVKIREERVRDWQNRDILSIAGCRDCNLSLACGGGCAMVARQREGSLHARDCRPVQELLELGISLYASNDVSQKIP